MNRALPKKKKKYIVSSENRVRLSQASQLQKFLLGHYFFQCHEIWTHHNNLLYGRLNMHNMIGSIFIGSVNCTWLNLHEIIRVFIVTID